MKPCFLDTCAVIDLMAGRQAALDALADFDHLLVSYVRNLGSTNRWPVWRRLPAVATLRD